MLKNILAVIAGYAAMFLFVFVCLGAAYAMLGADGAFKEGTFDVSILWVIIMLIVNILAALLGGITCAKVSKHSKRAVQSLMLLVVLLGMFMAFAVINAPEDATLAVREPDTPMGEAMMNAKKPTWSLFADPMIGAVGVMLGATIVCPCRGKNGGATESPSDD